MGAREVVLCLGSLAAAYLSGCSKESPVSPELSFVTRSNVPLQVSRENQFVIGTDTLNVTDTGVQVSARVKVNYHGDSTNSRDESFVLWLARLVPDPNNDSLLVVDVSNALSFRPKEGVPCDAVVDDSVGAQGEVARDVGLLMDSNNEVAIFEGQYVVMLTHGSAHNGECLRSPEGIGPDVVDISQISISGRTINPPPRAKVFFESSR